MIDASAFASHHVAFWSAQAPTSEYFVRRVNLEYAQRCEPPLLKPESEIRAAFVAEFAFLGFCCAAEGSEAALAEARRRLAALAGDPKFLDEPLSKDELLQASAIRGRLAGFFQGRNMVFAGRPVFRGCGFIDASEGDVISGETLFEVKAVERTFRSVDFRQLLTYCALNYASEQYNLFNIGIYNPRRGQVFEMDIEQVCFEMAGISRREFFSNILHVLSSGEISR